jgi:hypothetical protein
MPSSVLGYSGSWWGIVAALIRMSFDHLDLRVSAEVGAMMSLPTVILRATNTKARPS